MSEGDQVPSRIADWDRVLLYCLGAALFYSLIHGGVFFPETLDALEFIAFAIGLSAMLKSSTVVAAVPVPMSLTEVFGMIQDIEA